MQRILGLDVGARRIGVAVSDPLGLTAQRLTVLERRALSHDVQAIADLVSGHAAARVVVGLPLTLKGTEGVQAKGIREFVEALRARLSCPIDLMDERLTTVAGHRALREMGSSWKARKRLIDQMSAQLILQTYLDVRSTTTSS